MNREASGNHCVYILILPNSRAKPVPPFKEHTWKQLKCRVNISNAHCRADAGKPHHTICFLQLIPVLHANTAGTCLDKQPKQGYRLKLLNARKTSLPAAPRRSEPSQHQSCLSDMEAPWGLGSLCPSESGNRTHASNTAPLVEQLRLDPSAPTVILVHTT